MFNCLSSKSIIGKILLTETEKKEYKWLNSATAGEIESEFEKMWNAFWTVAWEKINQVLEPIVEYGLLSMIVIFTVIYFCSNERKCIYNVMKCAFIYVFYWMIRGALG